MFIFHLFNLALHFFDLQLILTHDLLFLTIMLPLQLSLLVLLIFQLLL